MVCIGILQKTTLLVDPVMARANEGTPLFDLSQVSFFTKAGNGLREGIQLHICQVGPEQGA